MATSLMGLLCSVCAFSQSWLLTGNSGTNPAFNFLGTTDNQRLVFRTDSIEHMTILPNGNVGIGTSSPLLTMHIVASSEDNYLRLQGPGPAIQLMQNISGVAQNSKLGFAVGAGSFTPTAVIGDLVLENNFSTGNLLLATNNTERVRITSGGNVGIGTGSTAPTARLQVECSGRTSPSNIRFSNLQSGTGTTLVIDSNGYVYRSASGLAPATAAASTPLTTDLQSQVEELKNQVQELRSLLANRLSLSQAESNSLRSESATWLGDNHPNPATSSTTIDYSLPQGVSAATCQVYSLDGKLMSSIVLPANAGKSQTQLSTSQLSAGIYMYSLIVNGKVLDTKKLVVSK
ncbi:MAG: T9SS type A sorting domain-containing protein [Bacteroidetes bacterium]|nr:T9SS type A sorting domain-containing protein [Bacteroidota bacterium]